MSLILKDGLNWHTFEASFRPEAYNRRREGESVSEWLKRVAIKDSEWLEKAKERERARFWLQEAMLYTLGVLQFLREVNMTKEELEDLVGFDLDLSGTYDWRISEKSKIDRIIIERL